MNQRRDWTYYAVLVFLTLHLVMMTQSRAEAPTIPGGILNPSPPAGANTFIPYQQRPNR